MEVNIGAVCTDVSVGLGCSENTALSYFGSEKKRKKKKAKEVFCVPASGLKPRALTAGHLAGVGVGG